MGLGGVGLGWVFALAVGTLVLLASETGASPLLAPGAAAGLTAELATGLVTEVATGLTAELATELAALSLGESGVLAGAGTILSIGREFGREAIAGAVRTGGGEGGLTGGGGGVRTGGEGGL
ncbi:hypothetical protein, partial [Moorena sp. SIO3I6]|uniref:hypothetical protein n=1 Tax=Moorena sp. SIO3I6 TaxID=2607831 RepID=UPI0013FAB2C2